MVRLGRSSGGRDMNGGDASMIMTATFMKLVGLWTARNRRERRARKFALIYTVAAMLFALWIEFTDFYHSFGDFSVSERDYGKRVDNCSCKILKFIVLCV